VILPEYFETRFAPKEPPPSCWPTAFAVITACNPLGGGPQKEADGQATIRLEEAIERVGLECHQVTGYSADGKHSEPGFAVWGCELDTATQLGREFAQNAIYWVEGGQLDVVSCSSAEREHVGLWSERLRPELFLRGV
jgi:hypothetical protein